ncbi:peptide transporter family 1-like isoform X2 [Adelges cooleyi]|uniref:peptide transporter family 1-like isoform X2 n=1 Tax=Adelges cooleyi TaxID=133065 RepID=UPI00217FC42A|nr:peptide transporter family 1-like isoform X2 [Adelges cooleyi]
MEPFYSETNLKFPRSIWFITGTELCERYNYFGLRTVLVLYLTTILNYSGDSSTVIYHSFIVLTFIMPFFGATLSDSYWGKFKTILRFSIVYIVGNTILTAASLASMFSLDFQRWIAIMGLILVASGTGGIKPCMFTFGGDQFIMPEQQNQFLIYTKMYLSAVQIGGLVASFLSPEFRKNVHCFGRNSCYPLAFGVPSVLMLIALMIFLLGSNKYKKRKPDFGGVQKTFACIFYALRKTITKTSLKNTHWLDHAKSKYSEAQISDTKKVTKILLIYITYPMFWALYELQGSRWVLQATLMDGRINGINNWEIKPDQMHTIVPLCSAVLYLTYDHVLNPAMKKIGIEQPLLKIVISYFSAALAFMFAAYIQFKIFGESTVISAGEGRVIIYNGFDCNVRINSPSQHNTLEPLDMIEFQYEGISNEMYENFKLNLDSSCGTLVDDIETYVTIKEGKSISYHFTRLENKAILRRASQQDNLFKSKSGKPSLRIFVDGDMAKTELFVLTNTKEYISYRYNISSASLTNFKQVLHGKYDLIHNGVVIQADLNFIPTTFYTLLIHTNNQRMDSKLFATDVGNYMHILWQTPQFICILIGEVIFLKTSAEFSFLEAPPNLVTFVSACSLITNSVGNLLIVFISTLSLENLVHEYILYSCMMIVNMAVLIYLSSNYVYST